MKTLYGILAMISLLIGYSCQQKSSNEIKVEVVSSEYISDTTQYAQCHASTLLETTDGLLLAFFAGPYERHPDVCIYIKTDVGLNRYR